MKISINNQIIKKNKWEFKIGKIRVLALLIKILLKILEIQIFQAFLMLI